MRRTGFMYSEDAHLINFHKRLDMREARKRMEENIRESKSAARSVQKLQEQLRKLAQERHELQAQIDTAAKHAKDEKRKLKERIDTLKNSGIIY